MQTVNMAVNGRKVSGEVEGLFALSAVVLAWPELRRRFVVPADDDLAATPPAGASR